MTAEVQTPTVMMDGAVYCTERRTSVNLFLSQPAWTATMKRSWAALIRTLLA